MPDLKRVIPLELNPEIFNSLAHKLGLSPVLLFHDVFSITEPDLIAFLPQPILALIMLFPITQPYEQYRKEQDSRTENNSSEAIWFKQTIGNGCGLYALLHILANLPRDYIVENLMLNKLLLEQISATLSTDEKARLVEHLEQNIQLDSNYGNQGQLAAPDAGDPVEFHFITYIKGQNGHLYELDGRRTGPVDLGNSPDSENLLDDPKVAEKIQFYMGLTEELQKEKFALMAVAPALD